MLALVLVLLAFPPHTLPPNLQNSTFLHCDVQPKDYIAISGSQHTIYQVWDTTVSADYRDGTSKFTDALADQPTRLKALKRCDKWMDWVKKESLRQQREAQHHK